MKRLLVLLIASVIIFILGFQNRVVLAKTVESIAYHSPCDTPISYRLGSIDSRFEITSADFLDSIRKAETIWSEAFGKTLFSYDPKGKLSISLSYDERQMLNTQISDLDKDIAQKRDEITPGIEDYKKRSLEFDSKATKLNQEIIYLNSHGGADPQQYKKLKDEQEALAKEADELNKMAASLNQSTSQYNLRIQELNQTVSQFNEELKYRPEEGIYIFDENGRRIIIYFYVSKDELVHTLAHEMGHALGIDHIEHPSSIMYPRTTEVVSLSNDDLAALSIACRKVSVFETMNNKINFAINLVQEQGFQALIDNIKWNFTNSI